MLDLWPQQSFLARSVGLEGFKITTDVIGYKTNIPTAHEEALQ